MRTIEDALHESGGDLAWRLVAGDRERTAFFQIPKPSVLPLRELARSRLDQPDRFGKRSLAAQVFDEFLVAERLAGGETHWLLLRPYLLLLHGCAQSGKYCVQRLTQCFRYHGHRR